MLREVKGLTLNVYISEKDTFNLANKKQIWKNATTELIDKNEAIGGL